MRQGELRSAVSGPNWAGFALVRDWAAEQRNELMEDWLLCQQNQTPGKIPPLE